MRAGQEVDLEFWQDGDHHRVRGRIIECHDTVLRVRGTTDDPLKMWST
jgi:hypothetical protein